MVNLIEEVTDAVDPTQSASSGTETALRGNPFTLPFTAASDAADFATGNKSSPNPAVGAAVTTADFATDPVGTTVGAITGGDGDGGLGGLVTPTNIAIAIAMYLVVTRTGVGESIGGMVPGGGS